MQGWKRCDLQETPKEGGHGVIEREREREPRQPQRERERERERSETRLPSNPVLLPQTHVVDTVLLSLTAMGRVVILMTFWFLIFGVVSLQLWGGVLKQQCYLVSFRTGTRLLDGEQPREEKSERERERERELAQRLTD